MPGIIEEAQTWLAKSTVGRIRTWHLMLFMRLTIAERKPSAHGEGKLQCLVEECSTFVQFLLVKVWYLVMRRVSVFWVSGCPLGALCAWLRVDRFTGLLTDLGGA